MLFLKNSMTGSVQEISEVEYEQQTFSRRKKTNKTVSKPQRESLPKKYQRSLLWDCKMQT